jgi:hypothetical protein
MFCAVMCRERDGLSALLDARERCLVDKLSSANSNSTVCAENNNNSPSANKCKSSEVLGEMAMIKVSLFTISQSKS